MVKSSATRDVYFRNSKEDGYRARSAYKLLHLDEEFQLFLNVDKCVDLCAAPGSWSQVLSKKLNEGRLNNSERAKIVAVDLQPMAPIEGVILLEGDITTTKIANQVIEYFQGDLADLIVCDGAPDITGLHDLDEFVQAQLLLAALQITLRILKPKGNFVAKIFTGQDINLLFDQCRCYFNKVTLVKPRSSRASSMEAFIVCQDFRSLPSDFQHKMRMETFNLDNPLVRDMKLISPFLTTGDLSAFDEGGVEKYYTLDDDEEEKEVVPLKGLSFC